MILRKMKNYTPRVDIYSYQHSTFMSSYITQSYLLPLQPRSINLLLKSTGILKVEEKGLLNSEPLKAI